MEAIKAWLKWLRDLLKGHEQANTTTAQTTAQPAAKVKPREPYVFVTVHGKKFHYDRLCPGLRNAKEVKMDLSKARAAGYTACDKCCYSYLHE